VTYDTPAALRMALEQRLLTRSLELGVALDRLRRRVLFERIIARLDAAEPDHWVVKGGMALEVRLQDAARLTKDLDLGLRDDVDDVRDLHDRVSDALATELDGDGFVLHAAVPAALNPDGAGRLTWRLRVSASLAGKPFGGIPLDVSPRTHELDRTDRLPLANLLDFAGVPTRVVEIVDVQRHAAEKLHAMLRSHGDRENTRVRDLVDLVLMLEHDQLDPALVADTAVQVWAERDRTEPPGSLPPVPASWSVSYERYTAELDVTANSFAFGVARVAELWAEMFPTEET
jgi:hypothetical protein